MAQANHPEGSALLEREDELAALGEVVERAVRGTGSVVVLEGPAGSGKSSLAAAAGRLAGQSGLRVLGARGGELESDYPFGVVRQLYEPLLTAMTVGRRAGLLAGAAAPAGPLLGLSAEGSAEFAAGFAAMNAVYWVTVALAGEMPLFLTVDDAHWADASSLRAVDYLARRVSELPVALLVALRPDEPGSQAHLLDQLATGADVFRLALRPLRPASSASLFRERIAGASAETCAAAHAVTAGSPFYLQELLRSLAVSETTPDADSVLRASVPSLGDRVIRRAATVAEAAPALMRATAVLGDGARLATVAALAAVPAEQASAIAHGLRRIEVLSSEDPVAFVHPLVRRSVYEAMPESERQSAHRNAAAVLEQEGSPQEAIAAHLRMLTPSGDSAVAQTLLKAGAHAIARAAPDEAVDWLERALAEEAPEPPRVGLLTQLALALALQRDPGAIGRLEEAYALADEPRLRGSLAAMLAELLVYAGQWSPALDVIESIESELDAADPEIRTEIAALRAAVTLFDPAHIDEFDARRASYGQQALGDQWAAHALAALLAVEAGHRGRPLEAVAFAERALADGRLLGERGAGAWAPPQVIGALIEAEELGRAEVALELLGSAARASGAMLGLYTTAAYRGWINARRGDLVAAEADLTTTIGFAEQTGMMMWITTVAFCLADVLLEREGVAEVADLVEQVELSPDFLSTVSGAMLLEVRGRLRILRRDASGGIDDLRTAGGTISALRFGPAFSSWRSSLALALPVADRAEARVLAGDELALARPTGLARPVGIALRAVGMLADSSDEIELLRESVDVLAGSPARLEHARSLVELGASLRRANRRADARPVLERGLELAHACGADRLGARASQELRAAGGRRSRIATSGRDALTASELRVGKLAATGATNTEIAQELYISIKTVETHLAHAYVKLGLAGPGSRGRLAGLLDDRE